MSSPWSSSWGSGGIALGSSARVARSRLYDTLTKLPNRTLFRQRVDRAVREWQRRGSLFGLLFVDLDGFKPVNDRFGHAGGDRVLRVVAKRLTLSVRPEDVVARFGGDEFVVLCHDLRDQKHAEEIAERLRVAISQPLEIDGERVRVGASVGVALPDGVTTAEEMLHRADLAMYEAKRAGRNGQPAQGSEPGAVTIPHHVPAP